MLELKSEFLCETIGEVDNPQVVGETPNGIRMIYPVSGGTVKGPKLSGEVLAFGADWILLGPDGVNKIDVRITIRTDDDQYIYCYYCGILEISPEIMERIQNGEDVDPSEYYFRTTPVFETGSEKYSWLNRIVCVGVGKLEHKKVHYKIYQIL